MSKLHVTVIDDDASALSSVRALLQSFDYEVSSFQTAEDFLESEAISTTSCLLVDVQLPGMTGRELQITLGQTGCSAPIILISGYADSALTKGALSDGAIAVLEKPIMPHTLIAHIQRATHRPFPR